MHILTGRPMRTTPDCAGFRVCASAYFFVFVLHLYLYLLLKIFLLIAKSSLNLEEALFTRLDFALWSLDDTNDLIRQFTILSAAYPNLVLEIVKPNKKKNLFTHSHIVPPLNILGLGGVRVPFFRK